ncbi:serum response factor-like isoform X2 [Lineus longissimus]|uniref:serum response factor-like isoform X2 n=1 Tax=Lineus longissimus TaxID=88925 RepID=UPI002B4E3B3D
MAGAGERTTVSDPLQTINLMQHHSYESVMNGVAVANAHSAYNLTVPGTSQVTVVKRTPEEAGLLEMHDMSDSDSDMDIRRHGKASKKTKGRVKIKMEFIENKLRRYTTFSKRKTGIMKKAYELSTLTGTQVMLLVASETGHVYTFATRKLQPMITSESGKALIQTCLNSPDPPPMAPGQQHAIDQRMNPTGFEETDLTYAVTEEEAAMNSRNDGMRPAIYTMATNISPSVSPSPPAPTPPPSMSSMSQSTVTMLPQPAHSTPHSTPTFLPNPNTPVTLSAMPSVPPTVSTPNPSSSVTTIPSAANRGISMQLPNIPGGLATLIQQQAGNLAQGTPITISGLQGTQLGQLAGQQQALLRIPAVSLAGLTATGGSPQSTSPGQQELQTLASSAPMTTQSTGGGITVLSGAGGQGAGSGGTMMYQTPQGLVYATPATGNALNALSEGYILNLPQQSVLAAGGDQQNGVGQSYFTIPVPVSLSSQLGSQVMLAHTGDGQAIEIPPAHQGSHQKRK